MTVFHIKYKLAREAATKWDSSPIRPIRQAHIEAADIFAAFRKLEQQLQLQSEDAARICSLTCESDSNAVLIT